MESRGRHEANECGDMNHEDPRCDNCTLCDSNKAQYCEEKEKPYGAFDNRMIFNDSGKIVICTCCTYDSYEAGLVRLSLLTEL